MWIMNQDHDAKYKYEPRDNILSTSFGRVGDGYTIQLFFDNCMLGDFDSVTEAMDVMIEIIEAEEAGLEEFTVPGWSDYD